MQRFAPCLALVACGGTDPSAGDGDSPPAATPDQLAWDALSGCVATESRQDAAGTETDLVVFTHDENGDLVHTEWTDHVAPNTSWSDDVTLDAPHHPESLVARYTASGDVFLRETYEFDGDDIVRDEEDWSNNTQDEISTYTWDDHRMTGWSWDFGSDGTVDDTATFTWTPAGDEWDVVGDGEDPNGPYGTTAHYTSESWETEYHYWDSTGLTDDRIDQPFSAIGTRGGYTSTFAQDGTTTATTTEVVEFDAIGRLSHQTETDETWSAGAVSDTTVIDKVWSYDCP